MRSTFIFPPLKSPGPEANAAFNVVIAYEDFESGRHALRTYDFLVEHLGHECRFDHQMWKFDVLAMPKLREMAAQDAAMADIILVAARGTNELPEQVKAWAELWLRTGTRASAVVALFETPEPPGGNRVRGCLAEVARRAGVEFFSQPGNWPGGLPSEAHASSDNQWYHGKTFSLLTGAIQEPPEVLHWGINE